MEPGQRLSRRARRAGGVRDPELVKQGKRRTFIGEVRGADPGRGGRVHAAG